METKEKMNEIAKENIRVRIIKAMESEKLTKGKAAILLGVNAPYLSLISSKHTVAEHIWDTLQKWCNSGLTMSKYGEKMKNDMIPLEEDATKKTLKKESRNEYDSISYENFYKGYNLWKSGKTISEIANELWISERIMLVIVEPAWINMENKLQEEKIQNIPPTLKQVTKYCEERNNKINPAQFISYYENNGWKVGNDKMKDWKASVRYWETRNNNPFYFPKNDIPEKNDELCEQFIRLWNEMTSRELLIPFLKHSGYSGKLTKEIVF